MSTRAIAMTTMTNKKEHGEKLMNAISGVKKYLLENATMLAASTAAMSGNPYEAIQIIKMDKNI